jgi:catechol 2,3-dioxygenase-like lactoylglutathione lyase family enzyme
MLGYTTVGSTDFAASSQFYDAVLATLGWARVHDHSEGGWIGYGDPAEVDNPNAQALWLCKTPFDTKPASVGNGSMVGLQAQTREQVELFYKTALAHGGTSEGEPALREQYGPNWYLAYVRDPMGNKYAIVYRGV